MSPLILYDNMLVASTLTSSTIETGYDVNAILDQRPYTLAMFDAAGSNWIEADLGGSKTFDSFAVIGHNFNTVGVTVTISYYDGSWHEIDDVTPATDLAFMMTFDEVTGTKFKIEIDNSSGLPFLGVAFLGLALEMPTPPEAPRSSFSEGIIADALESKEGNPLGVNVRYNQKEFLHTFNLPSRTFMANSFNPFWNSTGKLMKFFFYAVDLTTEPDTVLYCQYKSEFVKSDPYSLLTYVDFVQLNCKAWR